jgi:allene oxide cyclase-like protein
MRASIAIAAVTAALAAVGTFSTAAVAGDHDGTTIRLYERHTDHAWLDLGSKGHGPGDQFVFAGNLFDREDHDEVGRLAGSCTAVSDEEVLCFASFDLEDGQIAGQGLFDAHDLFHGKEVSFPITGGTGDYRDASGEGTVELLSETEAKFTLDLSDHHH